jgi:hypothetical protein
VQNKQCEPCIRKSHNLHIGTCRTCHRACAAAVSQCGTKTMQNAATIPSTRSRASVAGTKKHYRFALAGPGEGEAPPGVGLLEGERKDIDDCERLGGMTGLKY